MIWGTIVHMNAYVSSSDLVATERGIEHQRIEPLIRQGQGWLLDQCRIPYSLWHGGVFRNQQPENCSDAICIIYKNQ